MRGRKVPNLRGLCFCIPARTERGASIPPRNPARMERVASAPSEIQRRARLRCMR